MISNKQRITLNIIPNVESDIELLVTANVKEEQTEEILDEHNKDILIEYHITNMFVEIVIGGCGIGITERLTEKQEGKIIELFEEQIALQGAEFDYDNEQEHDD